MPSPQEVKTLNDTLDIICRMIVYLGGVAVAISGIWSLISKIKSRGAMARMQKQIDEQNILIGKYKEEHDAKLSDHDRRLETLEANMETSGSDLRDMHELSRLTLSAVQELLKSNLQDGNNHVGMQKASDAIDQYLKDLI